MTGPTGLQAAIVAQVQAALPQVTIFDAPPVRAARPFAVVDEPVLAEWGTKDIAGREGRIGVAIHDAGERPVRLRDLSAAAEDAVLAMPDALTGGWRIVTLTFVRSRLLREGGGDATRWIAVLEFRVRMLREA